VVAVVFSLAVIVSVSGCARGGGSNVGGSPRVSASGKVDLDGKPVAAGLILFISKTTGNLVTIPISNGTYKVKASDGPNPGENAVTIVGKDSPNGKQEWKWTTKATVSDKDYVGDFPVKSSDTEKVVEAPKGD